MLCGISSRFQLLSPTHRQVIHALLTRPPLTNSPKAICPFDLNVLCTPPAFILSQDQTLECWYLNNDLSSIKSISELWFSSLTFLEWIVLLLFDKRNCRDSTLISHLSSFVQFLMLFNFQGSGACLLRFLSPRSTAYLLYHIQLRLSRGFLKFFKNFFSLFLQKLHTFALFHATFIFYHIFFALSIPFWKFLFLKSIFIFFVSLLKHYHI